MFRPDEIFNYFLSNGKVTEDWELPTEYKKPEKQIKNAVDVESWIKSKGLGLFLTSLLLLIDINTSTSIPQQKSNRVLTLLSALDTIEAQIPIILTSDSHLKNRFGNPLFKVLLTWLSKHCSHLLNGDTYNEESGWYFQNSFGSTRLDYGSGHEMNFMAFIIIEYKQNQTNEFGQELIKLVYARYITLIRTIISSFNLEPAGITYSHRQPRCMGCR